MNTSANPFPFLVLVFYQPFSFLFSLYFSSSVDIPLVTSMDSLSLSDFLLPNKIKIDLASKYTYPCKLGVIVSRHVKTWRKIAYCSRDIYLQLGEA